MNLRADVSTNLGLGLGLGPNALLKPCSGFAA
jgi:hypothetical protein